MYVCRTYDLVRLITLVRQAICTGIRLDCTSTTASKVQHVLYLWPWSILGRYWSGPCPYACNVIHCLMPDNINDKVFYYYYWLRTKMTRTTFATVESAQRDGEYTTQTTDKSGQSMFLQCLGEYLPAQ